MENNKRVFICIDFPDEVIKETARLQELISKKIKFTGKFTELENLHLTLKFLGEIPQDLLEKAKQKLSTLSFKKLNLKIEKLGTFSYKGAPRIIWLKITGKDIFNLQKQIDLALEDLFPKEERFMSHLTIARIKYIKDKKYFYDYIKNMKPKQIKLQVNSFKLKSSELHREGPVYSTLEEYNAAS